MLEQRIRKSSMITITLILSIFLSYQASANDPFQLLAPQIETDSSSSLLKEPEPLLTELLLTEPLLTEEAEQRVQTRPKRASSKTEDMRQHIVPVVYTQAELLVPLLNQQQHLFSAQASIQVDKRMNILIIWEEKQRISAIKELITYLDAPIKQVEIEARIVILDKGESEDIGVRWGVTHPRMKTSGSIEGNYAGQTEQIDGKAINERLNINLANIAASAGSVAFQFGSINSGFLLDLELAALQAESKAKVISSPRLLTLDREPAYIEQGTEIPYLEASSSGATSVAFKKAVLSLSITPYIVSDEQVILEVSVTQDRPGEVVRSGEGESVAINTQRVSSKILATHRQTLVIGGIHQQTELVKKDKVPFFGDIPLIGRLFQRTGTSSSETELMVFITPQIIPN